MSLIRILRINVFLLIRDQTFFSTTLEINHCDTGFFTAAFPQAHASFGNRVPLRKYSWSKWMRQRGGNAGGGESVPFDRPARAPLFLLNFHTTYHSSFQRIALLFLGFISSAFPAVLFIFFFSSLPWRPASTSPRLARSLSIQEKRYSCTTPMIQRWFGELSENSWSIGITAMGSTRRLWVWT